MSEKTKPPTDFNDLQHLAGLDEVRRQLLAALPSANDSASAAGPLKGYNPDIGSDPLPPELPVEAYADYDPSTYEWYDKLQKDPRTGLIKNHAGNLETILMRDERWDGVLGFCEFSNRVLFLKEPPFSVSEPGELSDADVARLRIWFHHAYWMTPPSRGEVQDAVLVVAQRRKFHPVRSYLQNLRWDRRPRLHEWMYRIFGAHAPDNYLALVGTKFLIGAVARVMEPGCKMDNVLILEGSQGKFKSSALGVLFGEWFDDAPMQLGDKDSYLQIQGIWGYEMAELDSLNKADSTTAKMFFSQRRDRFRPPYGHTTQDFPRQTVFTASTNQDEYLKDYTGNRRYWPVKCTKPADLALMARSRDQIWAEAYHLYCQKETWWIEEIDRELVEREQDARLQRDPWEEVISTWLDNSASEYVSAYEILHQALGFDPAHIQKAHLNRVAPIIKLLGWRKERKSLPDARSAGKVRRQWVYCRPLSDDRPPLPDDAL